MLLQLVANAVLSETGLRISVAVPLIGIVTWANLHSLAAVIVVVGIALMLTSIEWANMLVAGLKKFGVTGKLLRYFTFSGAARFVMTMLYVNTFLCILIGYALTSTAWSTTALVLSTTIPLFMVVVGSARAQQDQLLVPFIAGTVYTKGLILIVLPLLSMVWLRSQPHGEAWIWFMVAATAGHDIGGYFAGRLFGGKVFGTNLHNASPKKSIEGFLGGVTSSVLLVQLVPLWYTLAVSELELSLMAVPVSIAGAGGDIFMSLIKRVAGVKDTGRTFGPHGGVLDRVDGFLFAGPMLAATVASL